MSIYFLSFNDLHGQCHWEVSFGAWKVAAKYLESLKTSVTMGSHCSQVLRTVILQELPGTSQPQSAAVENYLYIWVDQWWHRNIRNTSLQALYLRLININTPVLIPSVMPCLTKMLWIWSLYSWPLVHNGVLTTGTSAAIKVCASSEIWSRFGHQKRGMVCTGCKRAQDNCG